MPLTLLQNDLRLTLNAYLDSELSLDDFRGWEIERIGSSDMGAEEEELIGRLALIAETVISDAADEGFFAGEARTVARRLEAAWSRRAAAGTSSRGPQVQTVTVGFEGMLASTEQITQRPRTAGRSPVAVTL